MIRSIFLLALIPFSTLSQVKNEVKFEVDTKESQIIWKSTYLTGGGHEGTIQAGSGAIFISSDNSISKGDFIIDMNSIKNTDLRPDDGFQDLEDHLKSDDFFSVAKFPSAFFTIASISPSQNANEFTVSGWLNLKGINKQIYFPAVISFDNKNVMVKANILLDRTKWGIVYKSENFFALLKDGIISNEIIISLDLVFKKPG